jgi:hypothetical protein
MDANSLMEKLMSGFFLTVATVIVLLSYDMAYGHRCGVYTDNMRLATILMAAVVGCLINKPLYLFFVACISILLFFLSAVIY